ncbi:MAG: homocysteine S-methyltransferase family protein [Clostridia bacterium]
MRSHSPKGATCTTIIDQQDTNSIKKRGNIVTFNQLLSLNQFVLLDGAMGTALQKSGLQLGQLPELLNLTHASLIQQIHRDYIQSGSQIIYTNTFGANGYKLANSEFGVETIISAAIKNARAATVGTDTLVALDIGPIGALLAPSGSLSFDGAYEYFKEEILAGKDADVIVIETMTDLLEMKAAVLAAKENCDKPILCTMTFEKNMRTFSGCPISAMALTLQGLGVDAIGVNCSLGPVELLPIIAELSRWTTLPIIAKPNAGLPDPETNNYSISAEQFADSIAQMAQYGVKIFGGCCGSDASYISAIKSRLADKKFVNLNTILPTAVCSGSKTVVVSEPKIVGERINPTGKKLFKEALKANNIDYILARALEQTAVGADILDVNVGLPGIDEVAMMTTVVQALQSVVNVPLQIDSNIPQVLESALRVYNGKPIINSVNGDEESLSSILPLAKKYGAAIVCLTIDEDGMPQTAEKRFSIAKKIVERAEKIGIPRRDIFVDCLTLTASAEQEGVLQTLSALATIKNKLGVKTTLGVSNVSFGLPNRELVNHTFLAMALTCGLDLAIINPNIPSMVGVIRAYRLLANFDKGSNEFIEYCNNLPQPASENVATAATANASANVANANTTNTASDNGKSLSASLPSDKNGNNADGNALIYAIKNGLKGDCATLTKAMLDTLDELEVINSTIIPALDSVGALFEQGKLFLPQLIQSASAAEACFDVIKAKLLSSNKPQQSKGKIILATVKGDMHDIGKNIVKVLLQNYGYDVIDLGKDVPCQKIVDETIKHNVHLVGLSALMTTTVKSMQETIALLRQNKLDCKIFVGGAVLTKDYALTIGADFYCKDAKESVDVAKLVFKE